MRTVTLSVFAAATMVASGALPARAQMIWPWESPPPQRTIMLSPGWHLNGAPTRTRSGLRLAVRNDAGVEQEMTVGADGHVSFAPDAPIVPKALPGRQKAAKKPERRVKTAALPSAVPHRDVSPRPADPEASKPAPEPASVSTPADASPAPVAPKPLPAVAAPQPAPTGPGYAHGVPINPLD